jgi:WD40 repeat protein/chitodextrinase
MRKRVLLLTTAGFVAAAVLTTGGCPGFGGVPGGGGGGGGGGTNQGGAQAGSPNLAPSAVITSDVTVGVAPLTVNFDSRSSTDDGRIVERAWDFGDGTTSSEIAPSHIYEAAGEYTVQLTIVDDGSPPRSDIDEEIISVTEAPVARFTVNQQTADAAPATFSFDASESFDPDGTLTAYRWDFGDGSTGTGPIIEHTYVRPGTYRVVFRAVDDLGVTGRAQTTLSVGIAKPQVIVRQPPSTLSRLAVPNDSQIFVQADVVIEPGVPFFTTAGLDRDRNACDPISFVYDATSGAEQLALPGHTRPITDAAFAPDGGAIISGSDDGSVRLFDANDGRPIASYTAVTNVLAGDFSHDSRLIAFGLSNGDAVVRTVEGGAAAIVWDLPAAHPGGVLAVAMARANDGEYLLATGGSDNRVKVWKSPGATAADPWTLVATFNNHSGPVRDIDFSAANVNFLATASDDTTSRVWNWSSNIEFQVFLDHGAAVRAVAFSPAGDTVVSGGADNLARTWSVATGVTLLELGNHSRRISAVAYSPNTDSPRIATGGADGFLNIWDADTGELLLMVNPCPAGGDLSRTAIAGLDFDPTGERLVAAVAADSSIQLDLGTPAGADLPLNLPQPLIVDTVPNGIYNLWVEIASPASDTVRTYAGPDIQITDPLPTSVAGAPPIVSLSGDEIGIVVAPPDRFTVRRQIVDLGPLEAGDRIDLNFMATPGYVEYFSEPSVETFSNIGSESDGFWSVQLLDGAESLISWFQSGVTNFGPSAIIALDQDSNHHYLITDTHTSMLVRIQRGVGQFPTPQTVYLDFAGSAGRFLKFGGSDPLQVPEFNATLFGPGGYTDADTAVIQNVIKTRLEAMLAPFDVTVVSSADTGNVPPNPPFHRIYFGGSFPTEDASRTECGFDEYELGAVDLINPRGDIDSGRGIVGIRGVNEIVNPGVPDQCQPAFFVPVNDMGLALANATAHQIGRLMGLRRTQNTGNDVMDLSLLNDQTTLASGTPSFVPAPALSDLADDEFFISPGIGEQDNARLLEATAGTP